MGLGCIKCQHGDYVEALTDFERGHEIASRIGNDTLQSNAAAQIALCYCRLGRYDDLLELTDRLSKATGPTFSGYNEIQIAYYSALAYVFRGNRTQAIQAITNIDNRIPTSLPAWLSQTWRFFKADILHIVGHRPAALEVARDGLGYPGLVLHCHFFAGGFARWLAYTADSAEMRVAAKQRLSKLLAEMSRVDALDQVEMLCAELLLRKEEWTHQEISKRVGLINQQLERLPAAVKQQLVALEMLHP
jgi:tetratricopeptide (TPR) repeat protein